MTPVIPAVTTDADAQMYTATPELPPHLRDWQLPPGWSWGSDGLYGQHRHYQEMIDALGRSLSLVTAPDAAHHGWLESEARHLAHRNHPAMPTTYHYWSTFSVNRRGPGYLRRWIAGETMCCARCAHGSGRRPGALRVMREIGSALSYLHDFGAAHGGVSPETVWTTPMGRLWLMGWQWAVPPAEMVPGLVAGPPLHAGAERMGPAAVDAHAAHATSGSLRRFALPASRARRRHLPKLRRFTAASRGAARYGRRSSTVRCTRIQRVAFRRLRRCCAPWIVSSAAGRW